MKQPIGILGAMSVEIDAILSAMEIRSVEEHSSMKFHVGTLSGVECVTVQCSVGKVNSALCAQVLIDHYAPRALINIGVAGGVGKEVHIGDVVLATACVQYDFDSTALGDPQAQLNLPPDGRPVTEFPCDSQLTRRLEDAAQDLYGKVHRGVIATGDRFMADGEAGQRLFETFGALACEMEGASIAHACLLNQTPCVVLRTISDNANDSGKVDFLTFAKESAQKAQKLLCGVIGSL